MRRVIRCAAVLLLLATGPLDAVETRPVIVDTDIGDDIDDAFALALLLRAPELRIDAVTTSYGDTSLRTRLVRRLLHQAGRDDVAVGTGPSTADATPFTQAEWAGAEPAAPARDAVSLLLNRLRAAPADTITLIALSPLTTIGAAIARDPATFKRLRQVVLMGGSVRRGYGKIPGTTSLTPGIEYNVRSDPGDFRRLVESGVKIMMMPLDATEVALPAAMRHDILGEPDPIDQALATLYAQWAAHNTWGPVPVLFDVVPVAWLLDPSVCRAVPIRLRVRDDGATVEERGAANMHACLDIDRPAVLGLLAGRLETAHSRP